MVRFSVTTSIDLGYWLLLAYVSPFAFVWSQSSYTNRKLQEFWYPTKTLQIHLFLQGVWLLLAESTDAPSSFMHFKLNWYFSIFRYLLNFMLDTTFYIFYLKVLMYNFKHYQPLFCNEWHISRAAVSHYFNLLRSNTDLKIYSDQVEKRSWLV